MQLSRRQDSFIATILRTPWNLLHRPAAGNGSDWTIPQDWAAYTPREHAVWDLLFARQTGMLRGPRLRSLPARAWSSLQPVRDGHSRFRGIVRAAVHDAPAGGWWRCRGWCRTRCSSSISPTGALWPGRFIRRPEQLDYLQEPDVFHDVFGHVPLLSDPVFADYMQAYGEGGLKALRLERPGKAGPALLVHGGVRPDPRSWRASSSMAPASFPASANSRFALDDPSPNRIDFDLSG